MNKFFKAIICIILLTLHMFGSLVATIAGLMFLAMGLAGAMNSRIEFVVGGLVGALICLAIQRFFISLGPSYMYSEEDW